MLLWSIAIVAIGRNVAPVPVVAQFTCVDMPDIAAMAGLIDIVAMVVLVALGAVDGRVCSYVWFCCDRCFG